MALLFIAGCGGGGSSSGTGTTVGTSPTGGGTTGTPAASTEQVSVAMTDGPSSSITAFVADVTSVQLLKANGVNVSALPNRTTVNFAELTQLSDLVSAVEAPTGTYTQMSLDLDFTGSSALVALDNGNSTSAGTVVLKDDQGNALTKLTVKVSFDQNRPLVIAPGLPQHVVLDFDLDQSCQIDESASPNVVTVRPVLSADATLQRPRLTRVRGLLKGVDTAKGTFAVEVHPYTLAPSGTVTLTADANTQYAGPDTNGDGKTDLLDLAAQPVDTPVEARGMFNASLGHFVASQVDFGDDVQGGTRDVAEGLVERISGTSYTLAGCTLQRATGAVTFNTTLTATIDASTLIRAPGQAGAGSVGLIGIGQRLTLAGALSGSVPALAMDCTSASKGAAGLLDSQVVGVVKTVGTGSLTLDVKGFGRRPVAEFDLAGHGLDPTNYVVSTGTLDLAAFNAGEGVMCSGLVTPGQTGAFAARAVAGQPLDLLIARWTPPGTASPFTGSPTSFPATLDTTGIGVLAIANPGGANPLAASPTLVVPSAGAAPTGPFVIQQDGAITVFDGDGSSAFLVELAKRVTAGGKVVGVTSVGRFDGGTPGTFTVSAMAADVR